MTSQRETQDQALTAIDQETPQRPSLRTYFLLLLLFCLCLTGGSVFLLYHADQSAYEQEIARLREDINTVIAFSDAWVFSSPPTVVISSPDSSTLLYAQPLAERIGTTLLSFLSTRSLTLTDGAEWAGAMDLQNAGWEPPALNPDKPITKEIIDGQAYLCGCFSVTIKLTAYSWYTPYSTTYYLLRSMEDTTAPHRTLAWICLLTALLLSVLYAVASWLLLRRTSFLSSPSPTVSLAAPIKEVTETPAPPLASVTRTSPYDLGLLCREAIERREQEAEACGITLSGAAQPLCLISCEAEGPAALIEALLTMGITALPTGGSLRLLVTKTNASVTLTVVTSASSLPEGPLAECRSMALSSAGVMAITQGTVSVTWEILS